MRQSTKNKIKSLIRYVTDPAAYAYLQSRKNYIFSPYKLSIYQNLLETINMDKRFRVMQFEVPNISKEHINIFLRHDVDTLKCVNNIELLLEANSVFKYPAGVYFLVNDDDYHLGDHKAVVTECKERGFEIGLHTICYAKDDYLKQFRLETEKFADETGIRPTSFTIHGMGEYRLSIRKKFINDIISRHNEFGYTFSDCHKAFRSYHHVIEDCHMDFSKNKRYIFDDFREIPSFFRKGNCYLILTHPCYWETNN